MSERLDRISEINEALQRAPKTEVDYIVGEGLRFVVDEDGSRSVAEPSEGHQKLLKPADQPDETQLFPYPNPKARFPRPYRQAATLRPDDRPNKAQPLDTRLALEDLRRAETEPGIDLEVTAPSNWYGGTTLVAHFNEEQAEAEGKNAGAQWEIAPPGVQLSTSEGGNFNSWRIKDANRVQAHIGTVSLRELVDSLPEETAVWAVRYHQEGIARLRRLLAIGYAEEIHYTLYVMTQDLYHHMHRDD